MYYSQFGEDKFLNKIFHSKTNGCCIEVGANNGIDCSNTFFFEKLGWRCILIEPNPELCNEIRASRTSDLFECAVSSKPGEATLYIAEGAVLSHAMSTISEKEEVHKKIKGVGFECRPIQVEVRTLDSILNESHVKCIDFITIDVEGHELEVLKGFDLERWRPSILLIEDNSNLRDKEIFHYLKEHNYVRFNRTGVNDWYADASDKNRINYGSRFRMVLIHVGTRIHQVTLPIQRLMEPIRNLAKKSPTIVKIYKTLRGRPKN